MDYQLEKAMMKYEYRCFLFDIEDDLRDFIYSNDNEISFYNIKFKFKRLIGILARHFNLQYKNIKQRKGDVIILQKYRNSIEPILSLKDFLTMEQWDQHKNWNNQSYQQNLNIQNANYQKEQEESNKIKFKGRGIPRWKAEELQSSDQEPQQQEQFVEIDDNQYDNQYEEQYSDENQEDDFQQDQYTEPYQEPEKIKKEHKKRTNNFMNVINNIVRTNAPNDQDLKIPKKQQNQNLNQDQQNEKQLQKQEEFYPYQDQQANSKNKSQVNKKRQHFKKQNKKKPKTAPNKYFKDESHNKIKHIDRSVKRFRRQESVDSEEERQNYKEFKKNQPLSFFPSTNHLCLISSKRKSRLKDYKKVCNYYIKNLFTVKIIDGTSAFLICDSKNIANDVVNEFDEQGFYLMKLKDLDAYEKNQNFIGEYFAYNKETKRNVDVAIRLITAQLDRVHNDRNVRK